MKKTLPVIIYGLVILTLLCGGASAQEKRMSENQIEQWIKTHVPRVHEELMEIKHEEPQAYHEELMDLEEHILHMEEVKEDNPALFERLIKAENLEFKSWELAEACAQTKDSKKKKACTKELKKILEEIFEIRLEERNLEIQELENEIKEIQSLLEKRRAMKAQIIDRRLEEMITSADETMEWW